MIEDKDLLNLSRQVLPGGVNSPVRAFLELGGAPPVLVRGEGPLVFDRNGKSYVDFVLGYGPHILGHAHPEIVSAITEAGKRSACLGLSSEDEILFAAELLESLIHMDMIRFVNSGTEATMTALRLARAFTKRDKFIKFEGCYHGHGNSFLVAAGSGALEHGQPSSPGVLEAVTEATLISPYNDLEHVRSLFEKYPHEISAVFIEPVAGNMNLVLPEKGFLKGLRELCDKYSALLVFDEVMTGFRAPGAKLMAYLTMDIRPDLICLGKVMGGGVPVGAYAGTKEIMEKIAPSGPVYQAGTLSGNALSVLAGRSCVRLTKEFANQAASNQAEKMAAGIRQISEKNNVPIQVNTFGSMLGFIFSEKQPRNLTDVQSSKLGLHREFLKLLIENGIHVPPSPFETWFLSSEHGDETIKDCLEIFEKCMLKIFV